jgi:hypothetical protein
MTDTGFGVYTCPDCGGTFRRSRSIEDLNRELAKVFKVDPATEDSVELCGDCYKILMRELSS